MNKPAKCDECKQESYCIYITREYKNLCGDCYDKIRPKVEFDPEDLPRVNRSY